MKAIFTSLCILCFTITSAQNFNAGFIGGFTTSQVTADNLSGFSKLGSRFGIYELPINKENELSTRNAVSAKKEVKNLIPKTVLKLIYLN